jgi:hypothetical protein
MKGLPCVKGLEYLDNFTANDLQRHAPACERSTQID